MTKKSKDFLGTCYLNELQQGTYFKCLKKDGTASATIYYVDEYCPSERKFYVGYPSDISKYTLKSGKTLVTTNFEY